MKRFIANATGATAALTFVVGLGLVVGLQPGLADDDNENDQGKSKIAIGLKIAPVPLNMKGRNRALVGLGSYIVNAQGDCNGCHSQGPPTEFVPGGMPYFGQRPTKVNPATYLGGGDSFGSLIPGSAEIITRNLTPDKTGRPEGGASLEEFMHIMRTGEDMDKWHPICTGAVGPHCIPPPFDGSLLQVMPWPIYANMTDRDLQAIYEYLSAVPCLEGDPGNPAGSDTKGKRCK